MLRHSLWILVVAVSGCLDQPAPVSKQKSEVNGTSADQCAADPMDDAPAGELFGENVRDGSRADLFEDAEAPVVVLIFSSTDCPIANRYAPEIRRLFETFAPRKVAFWLVYADRDQPAEAIRQHGEEFELSIPAVRDPEHRLVKFCSARRTPEAFVFGRGRRQIYRGRIDDRFTDYGKYREVAAHHDLEEAIVAALAGETVAEPVTTVIGCHIPGVDE
jgi:AhpC/TSA family